jgi:hypothetical protein
MPTSVSSSLQPQVHEVDAGVCSVVLAQAPDVEQAAACIQSLLHSCDEYLQVRWLLTHSSLLCTYVATLTH